MQREWLLISMIYNFRTTAQWVGLTNIAGCIGCEVFYFIAQVELKRRSQLYLFEVAVRKQPSSGTWSMWDQPTEIIHDKTSTALGENSVKRTYEISALETFSSQISLWRRTVVVPGTKLNSPVNWDIMNQRLPWFRRLTENDKSLIGVLIVDQAEQSTVN